MTETALRIASRDNNRHGNIVVTATVILLRDFDSCADLWYTNLKELVDVLLYRTSRQ